MRDWAQGSDLCASHLPKPQPKGVKESKKQGEGWQRRDRCSVHTLTTGGAWSSLALTNFLLRLPAGGWGEQKQAAPQSSPGVSPQGLLGTGEDQIRGPPKGRGRSPPHTCHPEALEGRNPPRARHFPHVSLVVR